jgi:hypothetical protein
MWCVVAEITINKGEGVLAQITTNNFSYERTRTKIWFVLAQITINKGQISELQIVQTLCAKIKNHESQDQELSGA